MRSSTACNNCGNPLLPLLGRFTAGLCLRCRLRWRHASNTARLRADQAAWSDASKRSRSYVPAAEAFYFDEHYWCRRCGAPAVFSAAQQKHEFEVEKKYIHRRRTLCDPCWIEQRRARIVRGP